MNVPFAPFPFAAMNSPGVPLNQWPPAGSQGLGAPTASAAPVPINALQLLALTLQAVPQTGGAAQFLNYLPYVIYFIQGINGPGTGPQKRVQALQMLLWLGSSFIPELRSNPELVADIEKLIDDFVAVMNRTGAMPSAAPALPTQAAP